MASISILDLPNKILVINLPEFTCVNVCTDVYIWLHIAQLPRVVQPMLHNRPHGFVFVNQDYSFDLTRCRQALSFYPTMCSRGVLSDDRLNHCPFGSVIAIMHRGYDTVRGIAQTVVGALVLFTAVVEGFGDRGGGGEAEPLPSMQEVCYKNTYVLLSSAAVDKEWKPFLFTDERVRFCVGR